MGKNKGSNENEATVHCLKPDDTGKPSNKMDVTKVEKITSNGVDKPHSANGVVHEEEDPQVSSCEHVSNDVPKTRTNCVDICCEDGADVETQDCNCEANCNECIIPVAGNDPVSFIVYESELQMPDIMRLIQKDLSEPYSIYTYRYFIHNWPHLCFMARVRDEYVGAIVCKLDYHKKLSKRGYIAMLAVDSSYRKLKIGSTLVKKAIQAMVEEDADEVVLETEITNKPALRLYENLGFVRDKRLFRYYLNGVDALRLKLWLR